MPDTGTPIQGGVPGTDYSVLKRMRDNYTKALTMWQSWWFEADTDSRLVAGDQTYNAWYQSLGRVRSSQYVVMINKVKRVVNMITGYQRKNRLTTTVIPIENAAQETADQLSGVIQWCHNYDNVYQTISDAFEGAVITGLNLLQVHMDYREDPENGEIRCTRLPFSSFIMDPFWTRPDLSDCGWIWVRKWLSPEQIRSLVPEVDNWYSITRDYGNRDGRFAWMAESYSYANLRLVPYDEYWEQTFRVVRKLVDSETGEIVEWKGNNEQLNLLKMFRPSLKIIETQKPTVIRHIVVADKLIHSEVAPYGSDRLPFVPVQAYYTPELANWAFRIQGVVRNLRDSQIELNRRRNKLLDILDSVANSGWIVKEDALVNPEDVYMNGQGRALFTKSTSQPGDVQPIPTPTVPPGLMELQLQIEKEIMEIAGVNEELFGMSNEKGTAGVLSMLRQGAGLVTLQPLFDKLDLSQKILGNLYLDLIQNNFGMAKVERILNKQPTQEFSDAEFQKYDCLIEEGLLTSDQKKMQFAQLLQMRELGVTVPDSILLKSATIQNKNELLEAVAQQEQQQTQQAMAQMQAQLAQQQAAIELLNSQAIYNQSGVAERESRAVANIGMARERVAQGMHDRSRAALETVQTLTNLEALGKENVRKDLGVLMQIQREQAAQQEKELAATKASAESTAYPGKQQSQSLQTAQVA